MKKSIHIKSIAELSEEKLSKNDIRSKINCLYITKKEVETHLSESIFLNAHITLLVLSGTATLLSNFKTHSIRKDTILLMSPSHLFNITACSDNFKGICMLVSKEFTDEMDSTEMIYHRIKYGVKLFNTPAISLKNEYVPVLFDQIVSVKKAIADTAHLYFREKILNCLFGFYLDMSNIIDRNATLPGDENPTRIESIIKSFIELLVNNYRKEHKVDFYSSRLHISSHYLTIIVKRITGQSVSDFIFEMLYSEARTMLTHSKLSIQEIATELHFSDQSAFGKFFKAKSGVSPSDFRRG